MADADADAIVCRLCLLPQHILILLLLLRLGAFWVVVNFALFLRYFPVLKTALC